MTDAEVIVVGGGHNGLICAAYLARAGVDTLLLESRSSVGGCASTVDDLGARFNICNSIRNAVCALLFIPMRLNRSGLYFERKTKSNTQYKIFFHRRKWAF